MGWGGGEEIGDWQSGRGWRVEGGFFWAGRLGGGVGVLSMPGGFPNPSPCALSGAVAPCVSPVRIRH